jgi:hypothetical protein
VNEREFLHDVLVDPLQMPVDRGVNGSDDPEQGIALASDRELMRIGLVRRVKAAGPIRPTGV